MCYSTFRNFYKGIILAALCVCLYTYIHTYIHTYAHTYMCLELSIQVSGLKPRHYFAGCHGVGIPTRGSGLALFCTAMLSLSREVPHVGRMDYQALGCSGSDSVSCVQLDLDVAGRHT